MTSRILRAVAVTALVGACAAHGAPVVQQVAEVGAVEVVLYSGTPTALVRQQATVRLREGLNTLGFSWATDTIDAASVRLQSPSALRIGEMTRAAGDERHLQWSVTAPHAGAFPLVTSFLVKGIKWSPSYRMVWAPGSSEVQLRGWVTVTNDSGLPLDGIRGQVVLGRPGLAAGEGEQPAFPIMGIAALPAGTSVRAAFLPTMTLGAELMHRIDSERAAERVERLLVVQPPESGALAREALPKGPMTFVIDGDGLLDDQFETELAYEAAEQFDVALGPDRDIVVERRLLEQAKRDLDFDRLGRVCGFNTIERYELVARSYRDEPVELEIMETVLETWDFDTDALHVIGEGKVTVHMSVPGRGDSVLRFTLIKHSGTRIPD